MTADLSGAFTDGSSPSIAGGVVTGFEWLGWVRGSSFDDAIDVTAGHLPNLQSRPRSGAATATTPSRAVAGTCWMARRATICSAAPARSSVAPATTRSMAWRGHDTIRGGAGADSLLRRRRRGRDLGRRQRWVEDPDEEVDILDGGDRRDVLTRASATTPTGATARDVLFLDLQGFRWGLRVDLTAAFRVGAVTIAGGVSAGLREAGLGEGLGLRRRDRGRRRPVLGTSPAPGVYGGDGRRRAPRRPAHNEL